MQVHLVFSSGELNASGTRTSGTRSLPEALQGKVFWEMEVKLVQVHRTQAWGVGGEWVGEGGLRMEDKSQKPTRQGPQSDRKGQASGCSLGAPVVAPRPPLPLPPIPAHSKALTALQQFRMERLVSRGN